VIQGDADAYGTLDQVYGIADGVSGTAETVIVPGCGHSPHHDDPEKVLAAMTRFVLQQIR
jgi:pimeloyl-ACP methyl ester carboxylesterase